MIDGRSSVRGAVIGGALAMVLVLTICATALATFTVPLRVGFHDGDDWEPATAADAHGHVYVLWSHYVGFGGGSAGEVDPSCPTCASPHAVLQVSNDGGASFGTPRALHPGPLRQDDPQIAVDPADGSTVYAAFMEGEKSSEYVAKSTDFGQHWTAVLTERLQRGTDKDILAVRGLDVYLLYHTVQKIFVSVSHDGGQTWSLSNPVGTTNSEFGVSYASGGAVDSDGNVYFGLNGVNKPGQGKGNVNLYVIRSTDGGASWTTSRVATSAAPPDCGCEGYSYWGSQIALDVDDNGVVYVLWQANQTARAPQRMYFARSTNGAGSWSAPADVSAAPAGSNHAFPALVARGSGDVRIGWMDDRNGFDPGGESTAARWNLYYRPSTDGGTTWGSEQQVSAYAAGYGYKFITGFLQPYGDYFEMDINSAGQTVVAWGEGFSYSGPGNIWFAKEP